MQSTEKRTFLGWFLYRWTLLGATRTRDEIEADLLAESRQGKEATDDETTETSESTNKRQTQQHDEPSIRIFTLPAETVLYMPGTHSTIKCGDVCSDCKNNTDCKTYQRLLGFCKSFICKHRQRTTIHQKQAIDGDLSKIGSGLINQRRHFITKHIASHHLRCSCKSRINCFFVHKHHSNTKQDGQANITNTENRQTNIERFLG